MLTHSQDLHVFRQHPILADIEKHFEGIGNEAFLALLKSRLAFLYPKILIVSFSPLPNDYRVVEKTLTATPDDDTSPGVRDVKPGFRESTLETEHRLFLEFLDALAAHIDQIGLSPIVLIDFRAERIIDKLFLQQSLARLGKVAREVLLLVPHDIDFDLLVPEVNPMTRLLRSAEEFDAHLREVCSRSVSSLRLPRTVSLLELEGYFGSVDIESMLRSKCVISMDFGDVEKVGFFAAAQLVVYMHALSEHFGILWRIELGSPDIASILMERRFFQALMPILDRSEAPPGTGDTRTDVVALQNSCGIYVFDGTLHSKVMEAAEKFFANLRRNHHHFLDLHVSVTYDPKYRSTKPAIYRLTYHQMLRAVAYELVENVLLHSGGLGYFAAHIVDDCLLLFIGDSGKGAREGILQNYDLADQIDTDKKALEYLFLLNRYREKRASPEEGAGYGLRDSVNQIFGCKGKFICRTGREIASFMNPVSRVSAPSLSSSTAHVQGLQFMIVVPLSERASINVPKGIQDFLAMVD